MGLLMPMNFGMRHWEYQSFLVLPTDAESAAQPGATVNAKRWAKGRLYLEDAIDDKLDAVGSLEFPTDKGLLKLAVKALLEQGTEPAKFEAIGEVKENANQARGACYALVGWAFQDEYGRVAKITGSVRAVRGSDSQPDKDLLLRQLNKRHNEYIGTRRFVWINPMPDTSR
jgi:hypothetical protein